MYSKCLIFTLFSLAAMAISVVGLFSANKKWLAKTCLSIAMFCAVSAPIAAIKYDSPWHVVCSLAHPFDSVVSLNEHANNFHSKYNEYVSNGYSELKKVKWGNAFEERILIKDINSIDAKYKDAIAEETTKEN